MSHSWLAMNRDSSHGTRGLRIPKIVLETHKAVHEVEDAADTVHRSRDSGCTWFRARFCRVSFTSGCPERDTVNINETLGQLLDSTWRKITHVQIKFHDTSNVSLAEKREALPCLQSVCPCQDHSVEGILHLRLLRSRQRSNFYLRVKTRAWGIRGEKNRGGIFLNGSPTRPSSFDIGNLRFVIESFILVSLQ